MVPAGSNKNIYSFLQVRYVMILNNEINKRKQCLYILYCHFVGFLLWCNKGIFLYIYTVSYAFTALSLGKFPRLQYHCDHLMIQCCSILHMHRQETGSWWPPHETCWHNLFPAQITVLRLLSSFKDEELITMHIINCFNSSPHVVHR